MSELWVSLNRDIFGLIISYLPDGRARVRFAAMCRRYWALFKEHQHHRHPFVHAHMIRCSIADLERTLTVTAGAKFYVDVSARDLDGMLATLLWFQHGFNVYTFSSTFGVGEFIRTLRLSICSFSEEGRRMHMDQHGNIIFTTDYCYGNDNDAATLAYLKDEDIAHLEHMRTEVFPGTFDWRLIRWTNRDKPGGAVCTVTALGCDFSCGTCTQLIFRSTRNMTMPAHDAVKELRKKTSPIHYHGRWKRPRLVGEAKHTKREDDCVFYNSHAFEHTPEQRLINYLKKNKL